MLNTGCGLAYCLFSATAKQPPLKQCPAARRFAALRSQRFVRYTLTGIGGYEKILIMKKKITPVFGMNRYNTQHYSMGFTSQQYQESFTVGYML